MTYLIGWAVITAIYIVSVVVIKIRAKKSCEKYKQIVMENVEAFRCGAEAAGKELREENEKLKLINEILSHNIDERDNVIEMAARDRDTYKEMLIEHGLLAEPKEVVEVPEELSSGEIVSDEGEDE